MNDSSNKEARNNSELRKFALTLSSALAILGGILLWRKVETGFVLWGIALTLIVTSFLRPALLAPVYRIWMTLAVFVGLVMTHFILALMYYLMFTPIGLVMKLLGKAPLRLEIDPSVGSYWIKKAQEELPRDNYEKMF